MALVTSQTLGSRSASNSTPSWDVFLSYRGPDTGSTFTGHLYAALERHGVETYKDDRKLRQGEVISDALREAIKESKTYIVVFSKNYASSPWCLDELVDIIHYHKIENRTIIPVFYNIYPSVVRHLTDSFEKAFIAHQEGFFKNEMEKVDNWRLALKQAAAVSGAHVCENNSVEANIIDKIVADILPKINPKDFDVEAAVGLDSRVKRIAAMLSSENREGVIKIGLHGMGGVGKTTLAKAVFNQNYLRFEGSCFLANVSHVSGTVNGMVSLQQQLINDVLQSHNVDINNVSHGEKLIKARIGSKRILFVIDDINHHDQYKSLVVSSFAYGSVVIVTTRQEEILDKFGVKTKYRYMVNVLDHIESVTLFNQHAFGNAKPSKALMKLSKDILSYANGLPLALEVFGSFLYMQSKVEEWEDFIEKMKATPDKLIQDTLVISFNAIDDHVLKKIFLDIACFFIGWSKKRVVGILETYCSNADRKIKNLEKRCLLTIDSGDQLQMHDLLRDMGREIARNNSPDEPEKHSRLWISKDIFRVLKKDKGIEAIEGIYYNDQTSEELSLTTKTFRRMSKLRFLHLRGFKSLTGSFDRIFEDLTWLHWDQCPLECFSSEFHAPELVILELCQSKVRTLQNLNLVFKKLKTLDMSSSLHLSTTPDFTMLPCLVTLNLSGCMSLIEVHSSIGSLSGLASIDLHGCWSLASLPATIGSLSGLVSIDLHGCWSLASLPATIGHLIALESLDVSKCSSLKYLPEELGDIGSLKEFKLNALVVPKLPYSIGSLSKLVVLTSRCNLNLKTLPDTICNLSSLEVLDVGLCYHLETLPQNLGNIKSLKVLNMETVDVSKLPDSIGYLNNLVELVLSYNYNLKTLPDTIVNLRSLEILKLMGCVNLEELPSGISRLLNLESLNVSLCSQLLSIEELPPNLKWLDASGCTSMKGFPFLANLKHLENLDLRQCRGLKEIQYLEQLTSVTKLDFGGCSNLLSIAELPPNLKWIKAYGCTTLKSLPNLSNLKHLKKLLLTNCSALTEIQGLEELSSLTKLNFGECSNLLSIAELPPNLKWISVSKCTSLISLPNLSNLKHLETMILGECPGLTMIQGWEKLTALRRLDFHSCIHLLSIAELPPNLKWIKAYGCTSLKRLPNLSNLKHLEELLLTNCSGLTEIQGLEELSSIRKLSLRGCSLSLLEHTFTTRFDL